MPTASQKEDLLLNFSDKVINAMGSEVAKFSHNDMR